jgi:hypothetical protein
VETAVVVILVEVTMVVETAVVVVLTTVVETEADTNLTYFQNILNHLNRDGFLFLITEILKQQNKIIKILALPQGSGFSVQSFLRQKKPQKRIFTTIPNANRSKYKSAFVNN